MRALLRAWRSVVRWIAWWHLLRRLRGRSATISGADMRAQVRRGIDGRLVRECETPQEPRNLAAKRRPVAALRGAHEISVDAGCERCVAQDVAEAVGDGGDPRCPDEPGHEGRIIDAQDRHGEIDRDRVWLEGGEQALRLLCGCGELDDAAARQRGEYFLHGSAHDFTMRNGVVDDQDA